MPVGASLEEIRLAYVGLARRHHPDFHVGESAAAVADAGRRMQALNEAWASLSDPAVRRRYEADGATRFRPFDPSSDQDPDPRDAPDVPYRTARPPSAVERAVRFMSVALFAFAGIAASVGLVTSTGLVAVAVVSFLLSCIALLVVALLVLGRAAKDER